MAATRLMIAIAAVAALALSLSPGRARAAVLVQPQATIEVGPCFSAAAQPYTHLKLADRNTHMCCLDGNPAACLDSDTIRMLAHCATLDSRETSATTLEKLVCGP